MQNFSVKHYLQHFEPFLFAFTLINSVHISLLPTFYFNCQICCFKVSILHYKHTSVLRRKTEHGPVTQFYKISFLFFNQIGGQGFIAHSKTHLLLLQFQPLLMCCEQTHLIHDYRVFYKYIRGMVRFDGIWLLFYVFCNAQCEL